MEGPLPELVTERLLVRVFAPPDAAAMQDFMRRNGPYLESTSPTRPPDYNTVEFWQTRAAANVEEFQRDLAARFVLLLRDDPTRVIGNAGMSAIQRGPLHGANLGYALDETLQGRGLMTEALHAVIEFASGPLNLHRLFAGYLPTNERSARVLRRLGFEVIGYCRDYLHIAGRWQDHVLTSRVNPDWRKDGT